MTRKHEKDCPSCGCNEVVKNGKNRLQNQVYKCKACNRTFTGNPIGRKPLAGYDLSPQEAQDRYQKTMHSRHQNLFDN